MLYSGALERIDFDEEDAARGACLVQLARGATRWRFLPLNARPLRTLRLDLRDSPTPDAALPALLKGQALEGVILRLQLQLRAENEGRAEPGRAGETLRRAGVWHLAGLQRLVERPARAPSGTAEGLDAQQLLARYLDAQQLPPDRQAELLNTAAAILGEGDASSGPD